MSELGDQVKTALDVAGDSKPLDEYHAALLSAGISPQAPVEAPDPGEPQEPISLEEVVNEPSEREGIKNESLPMRFLGVEEVDGQGKYAGYRTFVTIDLWHPELGRQLVTHSAQRANGTYTPVAAWVLRRLKPGDVFQVGEIATQRGFTVYRPLPVR